MERNFTVDVAEIMAIPHALGFIRDAGFSRIIVESDSKQVIDRLNSSRLDSAYLDTLTEDCLNFRSFFF